MKGLNLLLVLAVAVTSSAAQRFRPCQDSHPCLCSTSKHMMTCKGAELSQIPASIYSSKVIHLSLCDNHISSLSNGVFLTYPNVKTMYLSNSGIYTIHKDAFKNLAALEELDLSFSPLKNLHPDTFRENKALQTLVLMGNAFMHLPAEGPILASAFLTKLDLRYCGIDKLSPGAFTMLPNLQHLDLSSNKLATLPTTTLRSLKFLEELKVDGNEWRCDCSLHDLLSWTGRLRGLQVQYRETRCFEENTRYMELWSLEEQGRRCEVEMKEDRPVEETPTTTGKTGMTQAPAKVEKQELVYSSTSKGVSVNNPGISWRKQTKQTDILNTKNINTSETEIMSQIDTDVDDGAGEEMKTGGKINPVLNNQIQQHRKIHTDDLQLDSFYPCNTDTELEKQVGGNKLTSMSSSIFQIVFIAVLVCMAIAIVILTGLLIKYAYAAGHSAYRRIRLNSQDSNHYESPYQS